MSSLNAFLDQKVVVITTDGRNLTGILTAYDNSTNIVLSKTIERIVTLTKPTEFVDLGVYILRGESVACLGPVDDEIESQITWENVRGKPLTTTKHTS